MSITFLAIRLATLSPSQKSREEGCEALFAAADWQKNLVHHEERIPNFWSPSPLVCKIQNNSHILNQSSSCCNCLQTVENTIHRESSAHWSKQAKAFQTAFKCSENHLAIESIAFKRFKTIYHHHFDMRNSMKVMRLQCFLSKSH